MVKYVKRKYISKTNVRSHYRRINGREIRVRPYERRVKRAEYGYLPRSMTNKEYKRIFSPNADADEDGIRNWDDCRPFDNSKQDSQFLVSIPFLYSLDVEAKDELEAERRAIEILESEVDSFSSNGSIEDITFSGLPNDFEKVEEGKWSVILKGKYIDYVTAGTAEEAEEIAEEEIYKDIGVNGTITEIDYSDIEVQEINE
ncbi:MAG: hypothetical protein J7K29_03125 [Candidatus Cloacimonetes bacterium]|nr:hypothetical protein [Candidatus Cloacimonadota bacterium]